MGVMIWDFPMRWSHRPAIGEYEAAEQAYRLECERLIDVEQGEGENDAPGAVGGSKRCCTSNLILGSSQRGDVSRS